MFTETLLSAPQAGVVAIPPSHFLKRCRNEYRNHREALIREFVQNSVDAGARRIDILIDAERMGVRDDGHGIEPDRLESALLTLGGSAKQGDSAVGGFGVAKEIILYAHKSYRIRTLRTLVIGSVLSYTLQETTQSQPGAEFTIEFAEEWGHDAERLCGIARRYLASCDLNVEVYLNGELVPTANRGRRSAIAFEYGHVQVRSLKDSTSEGILVRVNGLAMFSHYHEPIPKKIIVELEGDVRSLLTSNRDGLKSPAYDALCGLANKIAIDSKSFDKPKQVVFEYKGEKRRAIEGSLVDALIQVFAPANAHAFQAAVIERITRGEPVNNALVVSALFASDPSLANTEKSRDEVARKVAEILETDFVVAIDGTDYRIPPRKFQPGSMQRQHRQTALLYRRCIEIVREANRYEFPFRLGFILDPETAGRCETSKETGIRTLMINPVHADLKGTSKARFYRILSIAAHEVVHAIGLTYHNEDFASAYHVAFSRALAVAKSPGAEIRASKLLRL